VQADEEGPPVAGYERLAARDAMRLLRDLPLRTLEKLHTWEDLHLRRSSVLRAIKRAIDRCRRQNVGT
jgi:hypothetical protein